jgi:hypothetical protein
MTGWDLRWSRYAHFDNRNAARFPVRCPRERARSGFMKRNTAAAENCGLLHTRASAKAYTVGRGREVCVSMQ